jgi:DNA repair exonuclease SbcCD ATPase subunit
MRLLRCTTSGDVLDRPKRYAPNVTDSAPSLPPRPDVEIDVGPRGDALEACIDSRVREELARATRALGELRDDLDALAARESVPSPDPVHGARLARVRARRLEAIEGSVAVAMALAERTGEELRQELEEVAGGLADQLDVVSRTARDAALARPHEQKRVDARFDDVHRRIDAVTRELRAGVASLTRSSLPSPYGERLGETIGRRLGRLEGEVAVWAESTDRARAEVREELGDLQADAHRRGKEVLRLLEDLGARLDRLERRAEGPAVTGPLLARIEELERDRDAITSRLLHDAEAWADERAALQERVAELAARIVTGPVIGPAGSVDGEDEDAVPLSRDLDQLRIGVEGLRMRLAYHERTVAELAGGRGVDARIDEVRRLLARLEEAGAQAVGERDTVLGQIEQIAARMDLRLQNLEAPAAESRPL